MNPVIPTHAERQHSARLFEVRPSGFGGSGVFARRTIPKDTFIGTYPGYVIPLAKYERLFSKHPAVSVYAVQFFNAAKNAVDQQWIINPGSMEGTLLPEFSGFLTPYMNEPPPGKKPNAYWVWNMAKGTVEMYTSPTRSIRAGEQLFICYGSEFERTYRTSCTLPNTTMALHYKVSALGQTRYFPTPEAALRMMTARSRSLNAPRTPNLNGRNLKRPRNTSSAGASTNRRSAKRARHVSNPWSVPDQKSFT